MCGLKRRSLYPEFNELVTKHDIFCVVETKLDIYDTIFCPGYDFYSNPRKQVVLRKSGGIGIYIKNSISEHVTLMESLSDYVSWLRISKNLSNVEQDIIIGVLYIPPQSSKYYNADDFVQLEQEIMAYCNESDYVFLTGDFNAQTANMRDFTCSDALLDKYLDFDEDTISYIDQEAFLINNTIRTLRVSKDRKTNNSGFKLIDICKNNNLLILNGRYGQDNDKGEFTFRKKSVIDYSVSSNKGFDILSDFRIKELDRIYSDGHSLLQMELNLGTNNTTRNIPSGDEKQSSETLGHKSFKIDQQKLLQFNLNLDTTKLQELKTYLDATDQDFTQNDLNEITEKISTLFENSAEKTFEPQKRKTPVQNVTDHQNKPWFGSDCKKSRRQYTKARKKYQKNKTEENRTTLLTASKDYKTTMNKYINRYKKRQQINLRNMQTRSPKEYWKYLNSFNKRKQTKTPPIESFYDFFKDINSVKSDENGNLDDILTKVNIDDDNNILNTPITADEIAKCIIKLKNSKAPGPDNVLNEYIKYTKDQLLPVYVQLFNIVLNTGIIPEKWVEGMIMPIYKNKGDPLNPENYRPITLLSCLGKLFTAVLNDRLSNYLDENLILNENQAGFRKHYSTSDHIFALHSIFELLRLKQKKLYCAFVDFSKAFDSVWRVGLWNKLLENEINGKFFNVIYNLYQNIKSCISLNGNRSLPFESFIGLRQGENLSPALFSIFLNDLELYLQNKNDTGVDFELATDDMFIYLKFIVLLYADDTAIICESPDEFQITLDNFVDFCKLWKLNINYDKTKIVIFGANKIDCFCFKMDGNIIEIVKTYKYLGLMMSSNGSFLNARKYIHERANKAMHLLYKRIYNLNLPIDLQLKLFDSTILPIITYGSEVWGYENMDIMERIHNQFLRTITKCRKSTPMYMLYGELGRYPLSVIVKTKVINFWKQIITGKPSKFTNIIYQKLCQLGEQKFKWIKNVMSILQEVGRNDIWLNQTQNIPNNLKLIVKNTLIDLFKQNWQKSLNDSSKGQNYSLIKDEPKLEEYLKILPRAKYLPLIKYRTANHFLPVETLRWEKDKTDIDEKLDCPLCDDSSVADEFHYLLECKHFDQHRKQYLKPYYYKSPNILKYKELFTSNSTTKLIKLSNFVSVIMKQFSR